MCPRKDIRHYQKLINKACIYNLSVNLPDTCYSIHLILTILKTIIKAVLQMHKLSCKENAL